MACFYSLQYTEIIGLEKIFLQNIAGTPTFQRKVHLNRSMQFKLKVKK